MNNHEPIDDYLDRLLAELNNNAVPDMESEHWNMARRQLRTTRLKIAAIKYAKVAVLVLICIVTFGVIVRHVNMKMFNTHIVGLTKTNTDIRNKDQKPHAMRENGLSIKMKGDEVTISKRSEPGWINPDPTKISRANYSIFNLQILQPVINDYCSAKQLMPRVEERMTSRNLDTTTITREVSRHAQNERKISFSLNYGHWRNTSKYVPQVHDHFMSTGVQRSRGRYLELLTAVNLGIWRLGTGLIASNWTHSVTTRKMEMDYWVTAHQLKLDSFLMPDDSVVYFMKQDNDTTRVDTSFSSVSEKKFHHRQWGIPITLAYTFLQFSNLSMRANTRIITHWTNPKRTYGNSLVQIPRISWSAAASVETNYRISKYLSADLNIGFNRFISGTLRPYSSLGITISLG